MRRPGRRRHSGGGSRRPHTDNGRVSVGPIAQMLPHVRRLDLYTTKIDDLLPDRPGVILSLVTFFAGLICSEHANGWPRAFKVASIAEVHLDASAAACEAAPRCPLTALSSDCRLSCCAPCTRPVRPLRRRRLPAVDHRAAQMPQTGTGRADTRRAASLRMPAAGIDDLQTE